MHAHTLTGLQGSGIGTVELLLLQREGTGLLRQRVDDVALLLQLLRQTRLRRATNPGQSTVSGDGRTPLLHGTPHP